MSTKNAQLAAIIDQLMALRQQLAKLEKLVENHWNVSTGAEPKEKADAVSSRIDQERAAAAAQLEQWQAEACEKPVPWEPKRC